MSDNNVTPTNVESEIAAAKAKLAELEQEQAALIRKQRELEQAEKAKIEAVARAARKVESIKQWTPVADTLVAALKKVGFKNAEWVTPPDEYAYLPQFLVLGKGKYDGDLRVELDAQIAGGSRGHYFGRTTVTGYRILVGTYGNRKSYPAKKDGSYNYDKIAEELRSRYESKIAQDESARAKKAMATLNQEACNRLAKKYAHRYEKTSISAWYDGQVAVSPSATEKGKVHLTLGANGVRLTEDQAEKILAVLKEAGLLPNAGKNM